ncbi:GmrSD restriction endonuclease domain-containing protein [Staphylococcus agnetis]|uniref:GmrSD restriction endonucleases N-terminal domain-containing protein n=2 Tax=Staphylococcus agnetis TaxID=985762 RepID=A0ABX3Z364_9STAP|nr:DUF262 domain-containing protein [Staphylococcus agnetis]OSP22131.1 hypothetical protein B9L42_02890 [Staphylococcus agnetis]OSP23828.1 hypothetical protein B9M87_05815 [Staphylococcus agnetis]OTW31382.1 hypothetical protein B9M88_05500 [Staphylococcus agnetis]UXU59508.1 DUF262 domain-containing protein [Staphylococcus agnetis]UXU61836.1 DUF262 domain-containing protein [Staphylococcus agnetis]
MEAAIMRKLDILKKSSRFDASKEKRELTIRQLCESIEEKHVVIPVFQTYIRWTDIKVAALLNYQLHGAAPISPVSINLITKPEKVVEQMNFITREVLSDEELKGKMSVADGQQRLSANYKCYVNHEDIENVVLDLKKGKFVVIHDNEKVAKHQIQAGIIYNKDTNIFKNYLRTNEILKNEEVKDVLEDIRRKHFTYSYVINLATDLSKNDQQKWFEVLNLEGSRVTENMVYLSEMLIKGIDFYTCYAYPFSEKLENNGFGHLFPRKSSEVSIPLATLNTAFYKLTGIPKNSNSSPIPSDTKPKQIGKLDVQEINNVIDDTLKAMDYALNFIKENKAELKVIDRIDYITYLIGLFVEYNIEKSLTPSQKKYIINWINKINFVNNSNSERREKFTKLIAGYKNK